MTVSYIRKDRLLAMRIVGLLLRPLGVRFDRYWTTYRWPFGAPIVAYPPDVEDPTAPSYEWIRNHEMMHVEQQRGLGLLWSALLYFLIPLPTLLSGRWFIERRPYLGDIIAGRRTPETAAYELWQGYLWPWPRSWMVKWFQRELENKRTQW